MEVSTSTNGTWAITPPKRSGRGVRNPPRVMLAGGERQRLVQQGGQPVHERHGGDHAAEEIGAEVEGGAQEQSPRTAAQAEQRVGMGVTLADQVLAAGDVVRERVPLVQQPS